MRNTGTLALLSVIAALVAWVAVFMYAAWISAQLDANRSQAKDVQSSSEREIALIRLHALARDTENLRAQLEGLTRSDVIGVADTIDSVGRIAGVKLKIGGAIPESVGQKKGTNNPTVLHAVNFAVEADGTFASLMHAAELLETLPSPSSVQSLEFNHAPLSADDGSVKSTAWHLTARVRVLTTSDISS